MEEKLIKTLALENGLELNIFNCSRKVAEGRWLVLFIARIEIDISQDTLGQTISPDPDITEIRDALGNRVTFEQKRERNFVDEKAKNGTLTELIDFYIESLRKYLSNESFPKRYILKQYREHMSKRSWYAPKEG